MDLSAVPYMVISREVEFEDFKTRRVFIAMCLMNHMVNGVGATRDQALERMVIELNAAYSDEKEKSGDDFLNGLDYGNN